MVKAATRLANVRFFLRGTKTVAGGVLTAALLNGSPCMGNDGGKPTFDGRSAGIAGGKGLAR